MAFDETHRAFLILVAILAGVVALLIGWLCKQCLVGRPIRQHDNNGLEVPRRKLKLAVSTAYLDPAPHPVNEHYYPGLPPAPTPLQNGYAAPLPLGSPSPEPRDHIDASDDMVSAVISSTSDPADWTEGSTMNMSAISGADKEAEALKKAEKEAKLARRELEENKKQEEAAQRAMRELADLEQAAIAEAAAQKKAKEQEAKERELEEQRKHVMAKTKPKQFDSESEPMELLEVFQKFNKDSTDNVLTKAELQACVDVNLVAKLIPDYQELFYVDGDGQVNGEEMWKVLDENKQDHITPVEFVRVVSKLRHEAALKVSMRRAEIAIEPYGGEDFVHHTQVDTDEGSEDRIPSWREDQIKQRKRDEAEPYYDAGTPAASREDKKRARAARMTKQGSGLLEMVESLPEDDIASSNTTEAAWEQAEKNKFPSPAKKQLPSPSNPRLARLHAEAAAPAPFSIVKFKKAPK